VIIPDKKFLYSYTMNFKKTADNMKIEKQIRDKYRPAKSPLFNNKSPSRLTDKALTVINRKQKLERKITMIEQQNVLELLSRKASLKGPSPLSSLSTIHGQL